ncbi:MAG: hypothetical protein R6W67_12515 [Bacteroidales bacterium]
MTSGVPDKKILHRLGYYSNQEGIAMRYIREDENWNEHLSNTRKFIVSVIKKVRPKVVTVLGSGWLLDIPLRNIISSGATVRLVDIVHPPGIVRSLANEKSVTFVTEDLTGGLPALVWDLCESGRKPESGHILEAAASLEYHPDTEQGLILSINLLSQLHTLPFEYLVKKKVLKQEFHDAFAALIQEKHIRFLKKHEAVLITDIEEIETDRAGMPHSNRIIYCRLPAGHSRKEWTWEFDTEGSYRQGFTTVMKVAALHL